MALGLNTEVSAGDGEGFLGYVKYDARAGRFFRPDRSQDSSGNWQTDEEEITNNFTAVMDLETIQVGWVLYNAGAAPSYTLVKLGEPLPAKPSDKHKQGFYMLLKLGKDCGGEVRSFSHTAKVVLGPIDELHTKYASEKGANAGKLPVVKLVKTMGVTCGSGDKKSTNYSPVFEIVKWVDRPAELPLSGAVASAPKPEPVKAATVPAATGADDEEF
jgi:hypothetical protein